MSMAEITIEKLQQMFAYSQLKELFFESIEEAVIPELAQYIYWEEAYFFKGNANKPARLDPAHIRWQNNPFYVYLAIVDDAVEYRYSEDGVSAYHLCPISTDEKHIAFISDIFDIWYQVLNLPDALIAAVKQAQKKEAAKIEEAKKVATKKAYQVANPMVTTEITIEKIQDMFAYAKLKNICGYGSVVGAVPPLDKSISWQEAFSFAGNEKYPARTEPAHLKWCNNPIFAYVAIIDNAVEYRYSEDGGSAYDICPVVTDEKSISLVTAIFNFWYLHLYLPEALLEVQKVKRKVSRKNKLNLINNYLTTESEEDFETLTAEDHIAFWVDWREEDALIIKYCEDIIKSKKLSAQLNETEDAIGFEIIISYNGNKHKIPYLGKGSDRDTTIITLNEVLKPDFEIRFCVDSDGSDTLAFLPLKSSQWTELESIFGKGKVAEHFAEITKNSVLFG
jgi:hypothetical protein